MSLIRRTIAVALTSAALFAGSMSFAAGPSAMDQGTEMKLKALLAGPQRSEKNAARDVYRHPLETLKFFGLRQDMAVMEVWPGGGWWTEFLAPLLKDKGRYVAASFDPASDSAYVQKAITNFRDKLDKDTVNYGKVEVVALSPATGKEPVAPGTMDMVLTFRNLHNWMGQDQAKPMLDAMFKALKPGGYLGIVEHRGSPDVPQDPKAKSGYVREDFAVTLIESAGFKLVAKSDVNSNPKDTKDYAKGVWTLPPNFAEGETDKAKYAAIGETDRFTMLFQKPQ